MKKKLAIAAIIDNKRIIINTGDKDNVKVNDTFSIIGFSDVEILDPYTSKRLGFVPYTKARGRVIEVYENFSLCTNAEKSDLNIFKNIADSLNNLPTLLNANEIKPFKINDSSNLKIYNNIYLNSSKEIKIGDIISF